MTVFLRLVCDLNDSISACFKKTGVFGAYTAATIAVVLAKDLDAENLAKLSAMLTAIADILALIAIERKE